MSEYIDKLRTVIEEPAGQMDYKSVVIADSHFQRMDSHFAKQNVVHKLNEPIKFPTTIKTQKNEIRHTAQLKCYQNHKLKFT